MPLFGAALTFCLQDNFLNSAEVKYTREMSNSTSNNQGLQKEYIVRVPKSSKKRFNMMRFHSDLKIDFKNWGPSKMERENNLREFRSAEDDLPKYGAGSEYGREIREEAKRKRYGISVKKYRPEDQPWILTVGGKSGKKFKGIREGGVSDNVSWFVFMQGRDGAFEAYPIDEWYKFQPVQRYKSLSVEEAEKEFERRDKIMNFFSVMCQKKLKKDSEVDAEEEVMKKKGSGGKNIVLSEMDEWVSDEEEEEEEEAKENSSDDELKKKPKKKGNLKKQGGKKMKREDGESDNSCLEESDDYDEGAEHDYISSDSSDSEQESEDKVTKDLAGVEEGDALKKLLASDDEEEEAEKKDEEQEEKEEDENEKEEKEKKKKKKKEKREWDDSDSGSSSESSDESKKKAKDSDSSSKSAVDDLKRKIKENPDCLGTTAKKPRIDLAVSGTSLGTTIPTGENGVTEEAIRRYLLRKPMTTKELLQKFKSKKTGLSSEQLVQSIAQILKRVNPVKQMVKGTMYLSIKN